MMKPTNSLGKYRITYQNGVVQEKDLISHEEYEKVFKPTIDEIYDLLVEKKVDEANELKTKLTELFGSNFFTDDSPLYKAIVTGTLSLPEEQGGSVPCKVEKVTEVS